MDCLGKELNIVFRSVVSEVQMRFAAWTDPLLLILSMLNKAPPLQRKNVALITVFTGMDPAPPISIFLRTTTVKSVTVSETQRERILNFYALQHQIVERHPLVRNSVRSLHECKRKAAERSELPTFTEGDFVLVACEDFYAGYKLAMRWHGQIEIVKAIND